MVNPSTELGRGVVQALINAGVQHVVVAPGSRNAPISYALAQAAAAKLLTVHVRIDEREAGFLALGLAKGSGIPAAVVVTSGSAVANLLPAIVEAHYSSVPVIAITADRPASVRGHGAPQTIEQVGIFGHNVRSMCDVDATSIASALSAVTSTIDAAAHDSGPVHVNVQFAPPLMPEEALWQPSVRDEKHPSHSHPTATALDVPSKGLLLVGDLTRTSFTDSVIAQAEELGWPIVWEPSANVHSSNNALAHGPLVLGHKDAPTPALVVTLGAIGLSRVTIELVKSTKHIALASGRCDIPDPALSAAEVIDLPVTLTSSHGADSSWLAQWTSLDQKYADVVTSKLSGNELTGPSISTTLWNHAKDDDQLFVAASWSVRHIEAFAGVRSGLTVYGNRGTNGIDGLISTAWGIAETNSTRTYALLGDIAFLYGVGGLNVSESETRPNLTIVVTDNDGSGIFSQLEQGQPEYSDHFEQVFGTPHGRDLWVVAESFGVPSTRVTSTEQLQAALNSSDKIPGVHVIVCTASSRSEERELLNSIKNALS